jgi:dihydrofolate reductase
MISLVVATTKNRVIGIDNKLPWSRIADDLKRFKDVTTGHPVIMGSKTYESIPSNQRPLPDRTNIILTRDLNKKYEGCLVAHTVAEGLRLAKEQPGGEEICVIGGGLVFFEAMPLAHKIYLTEVDVELEGDTVFPEVDPIRWELTEDTPFEKNEKNQYGGRFLTYKRTGNVPIVEPKNGRSQAYKEELQGILASGQCPFCPGGVTITERQTIRKNEHWILVHNAYPLKDTAYHFMLFPTRHIELVDDITPEEWTSLVEQRKWLKKEYELVGDAMYGRSGEQLVTGASVAHLHWHIIVPAGQVEVTFGQYSKQLANHPS